MSPRAVYSTQLLVAKGAPLPVSVFSCPAGFVAVLREIRVHIDPGTGGVVDFYCPDTSLYVESWRSVSGDSFHALESCRTIITEGQEFYFQGSGGLYSSVIASGYLLTV